MVISSIVVNESTANVVAAHGALSLTGAFNQPVTLSGVMRVGSTSDYATLQVTQNSGSTRSILGNGSYVTTFWAQKMGA